MIRLTVSELNRYLKSVCDSDDTLRSLFVAGEISNLTRHRSGHLYFSLKDGDASIRCVMFARQAATLRFPISDGDRVLCGGRVSVYERDGSCQFYAERIAPDGEGAAKAALDRLYARLTAEGLFVDERKRPLPAFPARVAVITSSSGAALIDITAVWRRKWPVAELTLYPANVQGERAVGEICARLAQITPERADVVILARGGGSSEDLWVFNDERLVRAVADCPVPLVSAVGHEVDYTLCDLAASARAATPTAAADRVFPDQNEIAQKLDGLLASFKTAAVMTVQRAADRLENAAALLYRSSPQNRIDSRMQTLYSQTELLQKNMQVALTRSERRFDAAAAALEALSPLSVLLRGYAIASSKDEIVTTAAAAKARETLSLRFSDGSVPVKVIKE